MIIIPNVTILALWSSEGKYAYNYGINIMVNYWAKYLENKYKYNKNWTFHANIELIDYKSNITFLEQYLYQRLNTIIPSKVSVVLAPEGIVGINNIALVSKFNIPYILPTSIPTINQYNINHKTSFFIEPLSFYIFRSLIEKYVQLGVKTIATVSYNDKNDNNYNYLSCHGAALYLAVPRGIKYVKSFNLYNYSSENDIINIVTKLKYINPDVILWCDWQSCTFLNDKSRFGLNVLKQINYMPKSFTFLNCFNNKIINQFINQGLLDYVTQPLFIHPDLKELEYIIYSNPSATLFRPSINLSQILNYDSFKNSQSSAQLFDKWYISMTGIHPPYQANEYWAALDLIESAIYQVTQNKHMMVDGIIDESDIITMLNDAQTIGVFGHIIFDAHNININTPSLVVQLYPGELVPFIVNPISPSTYEMIYPIPTWSERIYTWKIYNSHYFITSIIIASICSIILITIIITIIIHRAESDIRMLNCSHMVAICMASIISIWSIVFIWQADMNIYQCQSYLWCVHLPISFVIQMMNMKAYRLSVYLYQENKYRFKKLNHNRMLLLSFMWISITLLFILLATILDQPLLVTVISDPYRPIYDIHYCTIGKLTDIFLYILVIGHAIFTIICVINIRNGANEFRDGVIMKEAFIILWTFITVAYIMQSLSLSISLLYLVRVSFVSIGLTMFCFRILISRCYRHVVPTILELIIIKLCNKIGKIIPALDNTYYLTESSALIEYASESESPIYSDKIIDKNSLQDMYDALYDPIRSKQFLMFTEASLFLKYADFLLRVTKFMNTCDELLVESSKNANDMIKLNAYACYHLYIRLGGDRQLKIEPGTHNKIMEQINQWENQLPILTIESAQKILIDEQNDNIFLFQKAYDEVSIILYQNVWDRFRQYEIEKAMC